MNQSLPSQEKRWLKYFNEDDINVELPKCSIYNYLWKENKHHLDDVAINYFDKKITYKQLFEEIEKATKSFYNLGVREGDIVIISSVTLPETIYSFYALNRIGAISNMVDPRTSTDGIRDYINEVQAKYIMTIDVAYEKIKEAAEGTTVEKIIISSPADSLPIIKKSLFKISNRLKGQNSKFNNQCLTWKDFIKQGENSKPRIAPYSTDSCCVIVHTGGTTGSPKGVMLSNENLNTMALQYKLLGLDLRRDQNFLNIMPPFIAYGVVLGVHMPLIVGLTDVLVPQFDPDQFADLIIKYKPAHLLGVPSYFEKLLESPRLKNFNLEFFESAGAGGDGITEKSEEVINEFLRSHGGKYDIAKGYGMTEISSAAVASHGNVNKFQSAGIPHIFTTVGIFEPDTSKELGYNQEGEICLTAPTVMLGYYGNEEETKKILRKHEDGVNWIHSGDIGYIDEDGFLFVNGRIKRMIVRSDGFKVFPSLIENQILLHEDIKNCCVVGAPDSHNSQGKLPVVFVEAEKDKNLTKIEEDLKSICNKTLPEYAQPREYYFIENLPYTPIGKVDYRALEKQTNPV